MATQINLADIKQAIVDRLTMVGTILEYAPSTLPSSGWLWANGQAVSRSTYADLFAAIGTTFGAGDGSTTFNVPDKRGRVGVGKDNMGGASAANRVTTAGSGVDGATLGASGGAQNHTLVTDEISVHTHGVSSTSGGAEIAGGMTSSSLYQQSGSTGGGAAHNNMQPSLVVNYIIKT